MAKSLYWKLFFLIVIGMICLFWLINTLIINTEEKMSFIAQEHQDTLRQYASQAETLFKKGEYAELDTLLNQIEEKEETWVAIVTVGLKREAGNQIPQIYRDEFTLGRGVDWKIHLYFTHIPTIGFKFQDTTTHFLINLPEHMRPGQYWYLARLFLHIGLPAIFLLLVVHMLYKHIMVPLRRLEQSTSKFAEGDFDVRVRPLLGNRKDELASLAATFDDMAERTQNLIQTQRLLIADLSHEMRTPIARMELALESHRQKDEDSLTRIEGELEGMRRLTQDALTLAWLETEKPALNEEELDLVDLLECIIESARFEFQKHTISHNLPSEAPIRHSNHRSLGQAFENVIRNALKYTSEENTVNIRLIRQEKLFELTINDRGPGVPENYLDKIFTPFFRVDKSRGEDAGGFGLGLSLTKRQIEAVGGTVRALNIYDSDGCIQGLSVRIELPIL